MGRNRSNGKQGGPKQPKQKQETGSREQGKTGVEGSGVSELTTRNSKTPGKESGGDLLSQDVSIQVPSALVGLTSVFGMGTGVAPPLLPPEKLAYRFASIIRKGFLGCLP